MRVLVLVLVLVLVSRAAAAEELPVPEEPRGSPWPGIHAEVEIGLDLASMQLGGASSPGTGPHLGAGWRSGPWRASATGDIIAIDERIGGQFVRAGATLRRSFATRGKLYRDGVWGGLLGWVEGGVGYQRVRRDDGMRADRPDLAIGVGAAYRAHIPGDHPRSIAAAWSVTAAIAEDRDVSLLFTICLELGR